MTRRETLSVYAAVALGGALGSLLRALASIAVAEYAGSEFPWGTLFVNLTGSFAIGFYAALARPGGRMAAGLAWRYFAMTGVCGGYTTCSAFSLETFRLWQAGAAVEAALYVAVSVVGWMGAVWLGGAVAAWIGRSSPAHGG